MNQKTKIALGGGGYCLYAPEFPRYQTSPGFSDTVHIYNSPVQPMFHLAFVEAGAPLTMQCNASTMRDGCAVLTYTDGRNLTVKETRFVTTDDRCVSHVQMEVSGKGEREIAIVLWTITDVEGEAPSLEGDSFRVRRSLECLDGTTVPIEIVWSSPSSKGARCLQAFHCEGGSDRPDFEETPWYDMGEFKTPRAKRPMHKPSPILPDARAYLGLFRLAKLRSGTKAEHRFEANIIFKGKGINYRPRRPDPKDENTYQAFMDKAPRFVCEDKRIERLVRHRFESLHMLRIPSGVGFMSSPAVCEGAGRFHRPHAFSAPATMREARWLTDPSYARGIVRVFFENIRQSGVVPGQICLTSLTDTDFFHADWGGGFEALDAMHPDRATKRAVLMGMQRYVKWVANNRDPEGSGLTDIVNQFEAGQELSRRFTVISEKADRATDAEEHFRLKGVDVSVFRYRLVKFLYRVADELQEKSMANRFHAEQEVIKEVIQKRMWDEKNGIFMDIDPKSRRRTGVKAAVGFYPMATDIAKPAQVDRMLQTLGNRKQFWTKFPVPTLSVDDPYFNPDSNWKGTRRDHPSNGRTWPMVNSHIMEALTYVAERGNKKAQKLLGELFRRTVTMLSGELDNVEEPRSFLHYHPVHGRPSRFQGSDWLLHSFVLDNIFRVGCGFAVRFGEVQMDPVIDDMPDFKMHGLPIGNKRFNVERKGKKVKILPV
ncbi:MAG: MGH1-like glycoside hydrolase domain-containing protein [Planctomycetota bacterium]|jgi:hypothetical protein